MNELYSNEINQLEHKLHIKGQPVIPVSLPVAKIYASSNNEFKEPSQNLSVSELDGAYKLAVPSSIIKNKRFAKVEFEYELAGFGFQKETNVYEITRRLVSFDEVNSYRGLDSTGDKFSLEYWEYDIAESIVRLVIEEFCNQKFSYWHGTKTMYGAKESLALDQYMSKFEAITTGLGYYEMYDLMDLSEYRLSESGTLLGLRDEWSRATVYRKNQPSNSWYNISGQWGYESIPRAVKEASLELIRYFISDDIEYRRKFFLNMNTSADSSYTFNFAAYRDSTGNPIADSLLTPYRIFNMSAV